MLVLSRKRGEDVLVGDDTVVRVLEIVGDKVRLGVEAPLEVAVDRREVREKAGYTPRPIPRETERLREAWAAENHRVEQVLGKALGFPAFRDDPANFPGATEADGCCVGPETAVSLADQAAERLVALRVEVERLRAASGLRFGPAVPASACCGTRKGQDMRQYTMGQRAGDGTPADGLKPGQYAKLAGNNQWVLCPPRGPGAVLVHEPDGFTEHDDGTLSVHGPVDNGAWRGRLELGLWRESC